MNTSKAIKICTRYNTWLATGNHIKYEELNTPLFQLALEHLIILAQTIEKEGNGLGDK